MEIDVNALELLPAENAEGGNGIMRLPDCWPLRSCIITCLSTQFPDPP